MWAGFTGRGIQLRDRGEGGGTRRLVALSATTYPRGDPECTLLSQVGDGGDTVHIPQQPCSVSDVMEDQVMEIDGKAPALDIRIGGFRMTLERIPARLLTALVTCGGSAFTAWFTTR